jgi:hypothetical protein
MNPPVDRPRTPAADARTFEEAHCIRIRSSSLGSDEQTCPLCTEPYDEANDCRANSADLEHPVRIDFDRCHHIFGHICLHKLINLGEPWSNRCPFCRAHWFRTIFDLEDAEIAQIMFDLQEREYEDAESSQEDSESSQDDDAEPSQEDDAESSQEEDAESSQEDAEAGQEDSESSQEDDAESSQGNAESSQEDDTEASRRDAESSQESLVYPFGAQDEHGREPYTLFRQLSTPQASTPLLAIGQGNRISIRVDDQRISIRNGEVVQRPRGLVVMLHGVLPSRRRIGSRIATATGSMFQ